VKGVGGIGVDERAIAAEEIRPHGGYQKKDGSSKSKDVIDFPPH
jgi:hypothetical protein